MPKPIPQHPQDRRPVAGSGMVRYFFFASAGLCDLLLLAVILTGAIRSALGIVLLMGLGMISMFLIFLAIRSRPPGSADAE